MYFVIPGSSVQKTNTKIKLNEKCEEFKFSNLFLFFPLKWRNNKTEIANAIFQNDFTQKI